jgi:hypothetical protein
MFCFSHASTYRPLSARAQMLIWYYWLSLVAIPLLFLFSVISLDFKDLLEGWISHRWDR